MNKFYLYLEECFEPETIFSSQSFDDAIHSSFSYLKELGFNIFGTSRKLDGLSIIVKDSTEKTVSNEYTLTSIERVNPKAKRKLAKKIKQKN